MKRIALAMAAVLVAACDNGSPKTGPAISVFTAAPSTITTGQSTQLVFGATGTLNIDQGVGNVTGKTSVTVSPTATTTYTLTASQDGITKNVSTTVTVNPLPPAQTTSLAVVRTGAGDPVAGVAAAFEVRALTSAGAVNPDYRGTVQFTSDDGQAVLPGAVTFAAGDAGKKAVSATFKKAGMHSLTGSDAQLPSVQGTALAQVVPAAATACAVGGLPATLAAGGQSGLQVTALDPFGNIATGYTGTIALTSSDGAAQLGPQGTYAASDAGNRAFSVQLRTAGTQTVIATDTVNGAITCRASVSVVPGSTLLAITFPVLGPGLDAWAGTPVTARVIAQDAQGNKVSDYAGTVTFTSSDGTAVLPANVTFTVADAGQKDVNVTFNALGSQTLTATDTVTPLVQGSSKTAMVHGLAYTDPAPGGKVRLVRNPSSTARAVRLDLVSNTSLFPLSAGTADTVRNGAFAVGMNLPLDASKVGPDATLLDVTPPAGSTVVLNLGTGTQAKGATLNVPRSILYSGISQKRTEAGSATVRGDVAVRPFPGGNSFYYSIRLVLTPGAAVGTVFDGAALTTAFRAAVRDRSGSDVFAGPDFVIGKLEVR
jgi:hypothetical protein